MSVVREPEQQAVWCVTCLLMATSSNAILRTVYPIIAHQVSCNDEEWKLKMLCTASYEFYNQQVSNSPITIIINIHIV